MAAPYRGYMAEVDAPKELVWSVMLDKIKHPDRYLPGVKEVRILDEGVEGGAPWVLRELKVAAHANALREKITHVDGEKLVEFKLVDHPRLEGAIYNKVHVDGEKVKLEYYSTHSAKAEFAAENPPIVSNFSQAVLHTKAVIEKLHAEGKTSV